MFSFHLGHLSVENPYHCSLYSCHIEEAVDSYSVDSFGCIACWCRYGIYSNNLIKIIDKEQYEYTFIWRHLGLNHLQNITLDMLNLLNKLIIRMTFVAPNLYQVMYLQ